MNMINKTMKKYENYISITIIILFCITTLFEIVASFCATSYERKRIANGLCDRKQYDFCQIVEIKYNDDGSIKDTIYKIKDLD